MLCLSTEPILYLKVRESGAVEENESADALKALITMTYMALRLFSPSPLCGLSVFFSVSAPHFLCVPLFIVLLSKRVQVAPVPVLGGLIVDICASKGMRARMHRGCRGTCRRPKLSRSWAIRSGIFEGKREEM